MNLDSPFFDAWANFVVIGHYVAELEDVGFLNDCNQACFEDKVVIVGVRDSDKGVQGLGELKAFRYEPGKILVRVKHKRDPCIVTFFVKVLSRNTGDNIEDHGFVFDESVSVTNRLCSFVPNFFNAIV